MVFLTTRRVDQPASPIPGSAPAGPASPSSSTQNAIQVVRVTRAAPPTDVIVTPLRVTNPVMSPNGRSVAFQMKGLTEYVARLEITHGNFASDLLAPGHAALKALRPVDLQPESVLLGEVVGELQRAAAALSDELSMKFFAHALPRSVLSFVD